MNIFGNYLRIVIFGASHEEYIGLTIDGYPPGIKINEEFIKFKLKNRYGGLSIKKTRQEKDEYKIISGYFKERTTGAPLTILILNHDIDSTPYHEGYGIARPSHADYTSYLKYNGFADYRGGGIASGRLMVAFIILGALCELLLERHQIIIASRIKQIRNIIDAEFEINKENLYKLLNNPFPVFNDNIQEKMKEEILQIRIQGNSCGGLVETFGYNIPAGLGDPLFQKVESIISQLIFSIPGVKGLEFGSGFKLATMLGSETNDEMNYKNGELEYKSNNAGGINGGITNGCPLVFRTAFRPTPSHSLKQNSINFINQTNKEIAIQGRHDPLIALKGLHVINAITTYAIAEMMFRSNKI